MNNTTITINYEGKDYRVSYRVCDEYIKIDVEGVKYGHQTVRQIIGASEGLIVEMVKSNAINIIKANLPGGYLYEQS